MSDQDDFATGREAIEEQMGYSEMQPDPRMPQEPDDEETYSSDQFGLREAANDLTESRGADREPLVERTYVTVGGEDGGTPRPVHETITKERAADDLKAIRDQEIDALDQEAADQLTQAVDEATGDPLRAAREALAQYQAEHGIDPQPQQTEQPPLGVDAEIYEALKNPKVQAALQAQLVQVEQARAQYSQSAFQAAQIACASLVASEPLLQGLDSSQISTALTLIERSDPARAQHVRQHLERVQQLFNIAQQAKAQEVQLRAQAEQHRLKHFSQEQEQIFEHSLKSENPETVKQVKSEIMEIVESYGVSKDELAHAYRTNPVLHSAAFQRMLFDAAKYKIAARTATQNASRSLPPVQKPGTASSYHSHGDGNVAAARSEFLNNPNARSAAKMIAARRRAS